jgi:ATP-binding cassette, subfamily B, bacterial CvaB/MchF/RaxB
MSSVLNVSGRRSTPVIFQSEAAECGLACLAMIAAHYGLQTDLVSLRRAHAISLTGATLAQLMQIASRLDLASRPLKVELENLGRLALPVILHWNFNHFVVLTRVRGGVAVIHDPAQGELHLKLSVVSQHFTGVALELTPTPQFQPRRSACPVSLRSLLGHSRGAGTVITQILLLALALEVFAIVSPFFMQLVVDRAVVSEDRSLLTILASGFLLLAIVQASLSAMRSWTVAVLGSRLNVQLVNNLFAHLLRLPLRFFEQRHLGDLVSRFGSLDVIRTTLTTSFMEAVIDGIMAVTTLAAMLLYSVPLACIVCAAGLLYAMLRWLLFRPLQQAELEEISHAAQQQTSFLETVRGIQSVKLFNRELHRHIAHQHLLTARFNAALRAQKLTILYQGLCAGLFAIENVLVIAFGALLVIDTRFSVGMLFAFIAYKQQFAARIKALIDKSADFQMMGLHTQRVADIALSETEPSPEPGERWRSVQPGIELRDVSFRYSESEPLVLRDFNLNVAAGEFVAIVGPSGCGKTTLLKVILGLLAPSGGEVLVGGVRTTQLGVGYRNLIGTVMQEDQLFAGSIADNICFFDPQPDQSRIEAVARLACIDEDIAAMPMGYNTLVGDMGTVLSGGQKQRVLLARALYKQPRILLLDEATSHLDVARERSVNQAVCGLNLTRIVVAHRPETIRMADRVIALKESENAESGEPANARPKREPRLGAALMGRVEPRNVAAAGQRAPSRFDIGSGSPDLPRNRRDRSDSFVINHCNLGD